ncbi:regulatory protein RecX [Candidatus Bipolaricaulota bacterium]|nr:regulatory protein RecX [Candidatus Bipolaricaulota bacterium]
MSNTGEAESSRGGREEELEDARSYLRLLLKYRPRTEEELRERLRKKDYSPEVVEDVVDWALKKDLVDDELFAEYFVEDRLQNKPKGRSGIYKELLDHGVEKSVAKDVLDKKISSRTEEGRCRELARKRLSKYGDDDVKAKYRKTLGFLERRGFSKGLANSVLKEILFNDD